MIKNNAQRGRSGLTGLVLAGGQAQRMGGEEKGLIVVQGQPMLAWVLARLVPQVEGVVISANRQLDDYARLGHPVVTDAGDSHGPLSGLLAGMQHADVDRLITCPCDAPRLPLDLVERLETAREQQSAPIAVAHDGVRLQPLFASIPTSLRGELASFLAAGESRVMAWLERQTVAIADFSDQREAFVNINTPESLAELEAHWSAIL